jgi:hypothetical protein
VNDTYLLSDACTHVLRGPRERTAARAPRHCTEDRRETQDEHKTWQPGPLDQRGVLGLERRQYTAGYPSREKYPGSGAYLTPYARMS